MRFDLSDEEWTLLEPVDAEEPQERPGRRPQDHECDLLRAADWHALARFAGTLRAVHNGLQSLQSWVPARYLEENLRQAGL